MEGRDRRMINDLIASNLTIAAFLRDLYFKDGTGPAVGTEEAVKKLYESFRSLLSQPG